MGLDQYLVTEQYLSNWPHNEGTKDYEMAEKILAHFGRENDVTHSQFGVVVRYKVAYWRKVYWLDSWFNRTTPQSGYVSDEDIKFLHNACNGALSVQRMGLHSMDQVLEEMLELDNVDLDKGFGMEHAVRTLKYTRNAMFRIIVEHGTTDFPPPLYYEAG